MKRGILHWHFYNIPIFQFIHDASNMQSVALRFMSLPCEWCPSCLASLAFVSNAKNKAPLSCLFHESNSSIITLILPFISVFIMAKYYYYVVIHIAKRMV